MAPKKIDDQIYAYEEYAQHTGSDNWIPNFDVNSVLKMMAEIGESNLEEEPGVFRVFLSALSQFSVSVLTYIESLAFGQPMGESLVRDWENKNDHLVFISGNEQGGGFIVIDTNLSAQGIYYLDLAAVHTTEKGIGTKLVSSAIAHILHSSDQEVKMLFARTQNPAAIAIINKALKQYGKQCFPIDRDLTETEQAAIKQWLNSGHLRVLGPDQIKVDLPKGIFFESYVNWRPQPPKNLSPGPFTEYLEREKIIFSQFIEAGNAFIVGGTL